MRIMSSILVVTLLTLKISSSLGFLAFQVGLDVLVRRRLQVKHLSEYLNRICSCKLLFCHFPHLLIWFHSDIVGMVQAMRACLLIACAQLVVVAPAHFLWDARRDL